MSKTTIYKQRLEGTDIQIKEFPKGFTPLTINAQFNEPCIWYICDKEQTETVKKVIKIHGTGHPITDDILDYFDYLGTFQIGGGVLIFHSFISKSDCEEVE